MGPGAGAFTKIEFPKIGAGVTQEDVDTFETILAQCTAFLERVKPSVSMHFADKAYNPADYGPGGRYYDPDAKVPTRGQIVLVDEENGSVVGELGGDANVVEDPDLKMGTKDPVEVQISKDGKRIEVHPVSEDYLRMARHPAYKDSSIVQNAATASRLIVTTSGHIGNMLTSSADKFTQKTTPNQKPLEFSPAAHDRVRKINSFTHSTARLSSKTVGRITDIAQNTAAHVSGHRKNRMEKGFGDDGKPLEQDQYKPGLLNKSMIAFSTIADGIATSGKSLLTTGGAAASTVVGHKYGEQAGSMAADLAGGVKNVGLVYIDVAGVSRRAVIKSVAKGMVVGKVRGGGEVVVGGGDGGVVPEEDVKDYEAGGARNDNLPGGSSSYYPSGGAYKPTYDEAGFGNSAPPRYQDFSAKKS